MARKRARTGRLSVGAGKVVITPPVGIHLGGYAMRRKRSSGIDRDLHARALVLDDGRERIGLVVADVVSLDDATVGEVRRLVQSGAAIPPENLSVAFTHSHSAPGVKFTNTGAIDSEWSQVLPRLMAGAVTEAARDMVPCRIGSARGFVEAASFDRTRPLGEGGRIDREVAVLATETPKGDPLAMLVNFACHPVVFGPRNLLISPDYPGHLVELLERSWGGTVIFVNGCCGDIDPRVNGTEWGSGDARECQRMAQAIGGAALHAASKIEPKLDFRVAARSVRVSLPLRRIPSAARASAQLRKAEAQLQSRVSERVPKPDRWYTEHLLSWARAQAKLAETREVPEAEVEIQALGLGPEILIGIPGEVFCGIGLAIKRELGSLSAIVAGYANGCLSYIPTRAAFRAGGYAANLATHLPNGTALAPSVGKMIASRAVSLARSVRRSSRAKS